MDLFRFAMLAQDDFGGSDAETAAAAAAMTIVLVVMLFTFALLVLFFAGLWKVFTKAGKPGWAAIIPIYNFIVMLEIVGRPLWWIILMLIPCVSFVVWIVILIDLAKSFGKDVAWGLGLAFFGFIFFPLLGFGNAKYVGPVAKS
ncbi:DUF5684 domain-containing protein [Planctopirus hydrillae]|uniref:Signal peptidase I n=1 Tax=Planctopirus hydrillae TaxID=1841610 RepID=A0A1C3EN13_9PLAN|nr:DUF5684 domain-containing protein [Planctopirus hydrillae]ODA34618.1 signal peptidase I [Planctopirus hydrillae]